MNITESIKFDKLESENETLKKEVAEKDKEINVYIDIFKNSDKEKTERNELKYQLQQLKYQLQQLKYQLQEKDKKIVKLKEEQLYKEDFKKMITTSYSSKGHANIETWELKDNSLYDKLPSKKDKTCI